MASSAPEPAPYPAVKTFLFTDLLRSTSLWEAQPNVMKDALGEHFELISSAVEECGGYVFNHTGDGLVAVFDDPVDALLGAVAAQQSIADAPATPLGQLWSRMGVNTGDCFVYSDRFSGQALNRCARLHAVGHGGQILVGSSTVEIVADVLPEGLGLEFLGEYWLRDLPDAERIHQVVAEGLEDTFPPLNSRRTSIDLLPAPSGTVIGRDSELALLQRLIRKERRSLITLVGQGGIGKTSLARHAAESLWSEFRDGVYWVDVASLPIDALATSIASDLGIPLPPTSQASAGTRWAKIAEALSSSELLLVLDSCEAHLATIAQFAGLLAKEAQSVAMLLTSRQPLAIAAETEVVLPPLHTGTPEDLVTSSAVELFVERAHQVRPELTFDDASLEIIQRVVTILDGLPLAIVQAASSLNVVSLHEIEIMCSTTDRLEELPGFDRLRSSFERSLGLLSTAEKDLLSELPVFAGSFTADAAARICTSVPERSDVRFLLNQLVNKSLLHRERDPAVPTFRMLEATRACSLQRTAVSNKARQEHLAYFQELAITVGNTYRVGDQHESIALLRTSWADIRQAVTTTIENQDYQLAAELVIAIHEFCLFSERTELYLWASVIARNLADSVARASILGIEALGAWMRGEMDQALEIAAEALALESSGPAAMTANRATMNSLSYLGRMEEASPYFLGVVQACQQHEELFWRIDGQASLAMGFTLMGSTTEAIKIAHEARKSAEAFENQDCLSWAYHALALALEDSDPVLARSAIRRSIDEATSIGNSWNYNNSQLELLLLNRHLDGFDIAGAQVAWGLLGRLTRAGSASQIWQVIVETAYMLASCGHFELAAELYKAVRDKPRMPRPRGLELDQQVESAIEQGLGSALDEFPESFSSDQQLVKKARDGLSILLGS